MRGMSPASASTESRSGPAPRAQDRVHPLEFAFHLDKVATMPAEESVETDLAHRSMHVVRHIHVVLGQLPVLAFFHQLQNRVLECGSFRVRKRGLVLARDRRNCGHGSGQTSRAGFERGSALAELDRVLRAAHEESPAR